MNNKAARNLFILGSLFFFAIFLGLTYDTIGKLDKRAPEITGKVNEGKMVWHKYDCIGCHTIFGTGSYFAPDMTKVAERKPKEYLKRFMMDPKAVNPRAAMPKLGITSAEADELLAFFDWISKVDTNGWPPKPILASTVGVAGRELSKGERVYQSLGCSGCHMINGIGGSGGPELAGIGSRRDKDWLVGHFRDPGMYVSGSAMPKVTADEEDIEHLAEYMLTL